MAIEQKDAGMTTSKGQKREAKAPASVPHGGWCPAGRRAEDGQIPAYYVLIETPSANYRQRTTWNVRDSDGTLIISLMPRLGGGSMATQEIAERLGRPSLHVHPGNAAGAALREFVERHAIRVLNVAGPRESSQPGIGTFVAEILSQARLLITPVA